MTQWIFGSRDLIAAMVAVILFGSLSDATAQTMENLKTCQNLKADSESIIEACSVFIRTGLRAGGRGSLPDAGRAALLGFRGYAYAHQGKLELAFADFDRAIRLDTQDKAALYFMRGEVRWTELRELDAALSDLDQAIRLKPTLSLALFMRSTLEVIKGDEARAAADQRWAADLDPKKGRDFENANGLMRQWVRYLKEIQDDGDYANWTGPPLDSFRGIAVASTDAAKDVATPKDAASSKDTAATAPSDSCALAATHWQSTESIATRAAYEDHLARFPNCTFAGLAKARLAALEKKSEPEPAPSRHAAPRASRRAAARPAGAAPHAVDDPVANVVRSIPDASVRNMINGVLRQNGLQ